MGVSLCSFIHKRCHVVSLKRLLPAKQFKKDDPKGKDIGRWLGYIESKHFLTLLKYIETDSYLEISYKEFVKQQGQ